MLQMFDHPRVFTRKFTYSLSGNSRTYSCNLI